MSALRPREVYLDWNATAPLAPEVSAAMCEADQEAWANPSSVHAAGRRARSLIERARETLAALLGAQSREVLFTSGATEANNLALRNAAALVTSRLEHPSVVATAELLEREGRPVRWLPVPAEGRLLLEDVRCALAEVPAGATLAVMAANHETGVVQPLRAVAELAQACGARLHVDASQGLSILSPALCAGAHSIALSAHKLRGPKGIGALLWRGAPPPPLAWGGPQERGARPGTQAPALIEGFRVAIERWQVSHRDSQAAAGVLRDHWERELAAFSVANGARAERLPHVSNLSFHGWPGPELCAALDLEGVLLSSGSACAAGTLEPSPVVSAMLGRERARSAVRFSIGETTTREQVEWAIKAVFHVVGARTSS